MMQSISNISNHLPISPSTEIKLKLKLEVIAGIIRDQVLIVSRGSLRFTGHKFALSLITHALKVFLLATLASL